MDASKEFPRRYRLSLHRVKGCYLATVTEFPGCVGRGESEVEAVENARIALRTWLGIVHALACATALVELDIAP
jgi:predicted RNase H-like HicB family nuclease